MADKHTFCSRKPSSVHPRASAASWDAFLHEEKENVANVVGGEKNNKQTNGACTVFILFENTAQWPVNRITD